MYSQSLTRRIPTGKWHWKSKVLCCVVSTLHLVVIGSFGIVSASEIPQKWTYRTLGDIPNVNIVADNMLIAARNESEHDCDGQFDRYELFVFITMIGFFVCLFFTVFWIAW